MISGSGKQVREAKVYFYETYEEAIAGKNAADAAAKAPPPEPAKKEGGLLGKAGNLFGKRGG